MDVISCESLTKQFGPTIAVNGLDLAVSSGQVYGFLGPNGAGKTTTIRMLLGLIAPSAGQIRLLGRRLPDPRAVAQTGSMIDAGGYLPTNFWSRFVSGGPRLGELAGLSGIVLTGAVAAVIARWRFAADVTV